MAILFDLDDTVTGERVLRRRPADPAEDRLKPGH